MTKDRKDGFSLAGVGAAACVACCAGPILAVSGGLGPAGIASTAVVGVVGLALTVAGLTGVSVVRHRSHNATCASNERISLAALQCRLTPSVHETLR